MNNATKESICAANTRAKCQIKSAWDIKDGLFAFSTRGTVSVFDTLESQLNRKMYIWKAWIRIEYKMFAIECKVYVYVGRVIVLQIAQR